MSTATDTPDERLHEYERLFEQALIRRERRADSVVFWLRADPEIRASVDALVRREAACCPFLDYRVETVGDEVIWTTANPVTGEARAAVDVYSTPSTHSPHARLSEGAGASADGRR